MSKYRQTYLLLAPTRLKHLRRRLECINGLHLHRAAVRTTKARQCHRRRRSSGLLALEAEADTWAHNGVDVVVDCSKVTFMDSMGLRFLLEVQQAATEAGHNFALANPSKPVMRVLELGRRTELFQLHSGRTQPGHVTSQRDCRRRIPAVVPAGCRDRLGEHGH